jgi:hypothetical protein
MGIVTQTGSQTAQRLVSFVFPSVDAKYTQRYGAR